jgi:hypothetical protein
MMTLKSCIIPLAAAVMMFAGCRTSHEVEVKPVEIKPIHITIDVNVKVQKALDDFFGEIDAQEEKLMEKLEKQDEN